MTLKPCKSWKCKHNIINTRHGGCTRGCWLGRWPRRWQR